MDLERMIQELRERLKYVDRIIAALEQLERATLVQPVVDGCGNKRRGRKFMSDEERLQVSERMRQYWSARRKSKDSHRKPTSTQPSAL
jgi:hypothetical protein